MSEGCCRSNTCSNGRRGGADRAHCGPRTLQGRGGRGAGAVDRRTRCRAPRQGGRRGSACRQAWQGSGQRDRPGAPRLPDAAAAISASPAPWSRDAAHPRRIERRAALRMAGHVDRPGVGVPRRRRPTHVGCPNVRQPGNAGGKGDKRIEADAKAIAYELDPHAVVDRAVRAETERSVWLLTRTRRRPQQIPDRLAARCPRESRCTPRCAGRPTPAVTAAVAAK